MHTEISGRFRNHYVVECFDSLGNLKWREEVHNLVTDEGANDALTQYLKGSGYTAAFYVGLISNTDFSAIDVGDTAAKITDTQNAPTTNGWQEAVAYTGSNRATLTLGTASGRSIDNSANKAVFNINGTDTIYGHFIATAQARLATTGVLYGEVAFSAPRAVQDTDVLNVTATFTL